MRIGNATYPIREGDIVACPAGGKDTAHQIKNTGTKELPFLAVSTNLMPEIVEYPDSGKFGISAKYPPGSDGKPQSFRVIGRDHLNIDYWEGEGKK